MAVAVRVVVEAALVRQKNDGDSRTLISILIGNQVDRSSAREVSRQQATDFARQYGMTYCETSATVGTGVAAMFATLLSTVYSQIPSPVPPTLLVGRHIKIEPHYLQSAAFQRALYADTALQI